jgi:hypothetical protein
VHNSGDRATVIPATASPRCGYGTPGEVLSKPIVLAPNLTARAGIEWAHEPIYWPCGTFSLLSWPGWHNHCCQK